MRCVSSPNPRCLERVEDLVALEHPLPGLRAEDAVDRAHRGRARAAARQERDPAAGREDARHVVERGERVVEEVQRGEAADAVEARVAEGEADRVAADVGGRRVLVRRRVLDGAREHRGGDVDAGGQPAVADGERRTCA